MNGLSLRHLRYFVALAQSEHFGRAAETCGVSQPALSQQIKEMESLLGTPLLERGARKVHLTALGQAVALRARDILQSVEELQQFAGSRGGAFLGKLRLGAIPTVAPYLLPRVLKQLGRAYPGLELRPREAVTQKLLADLLEARLDLAILALPSGEPNFQEVPLLKEEFLLVRPAEQSDQPVPSFSNLRAMELLLLEEGHCMRDQALSVCPAAASGDLIEGSSLSTLVQMVATGLGVTLIPEMSVALETLRADVSVVRLRAPRPTRTIGMVWRKTHPLHDQLQGLAAHLLDH